VLGLQNYTGLQKDIRYQGDPTQEDYRDLGLKIPQEERLWN